MQGLKEITKQENLSLDLDKSYQEALKDHDFAFLVKELRLSEKNAKRLTSKLQDTILEKRNCQNCKGFFMCKNSYEGHMLVPEQNFGRIYFSYEPCKYKQSVLAHVRLQNRKVRMKDIDTSDKNQLKVIKWLDGFYDSFSLVTPSKGLYLHGSFGSGKTFLTSALLNELSIAKNVDVEIVYFPNALRTLKEDWDNFASLMHWYQTVDILLLDDIGAEKVTDWGRDEILGTILQSRMEAQKTTFFTSNLTIEELEQHLSLSNNSVDKVKSRRIIERIKQLAMPMALVSENRRK